jgi:phosphoglycolate phosphatase-like HAD superfamily hydrolase
MKSKSYPLVVFDLDGTLADSANHIAEATNAIRKVFGLETAPKSNLKRWYGKPPSIFFPELLGPQNLEAVEEFRRLLSETKELVKPMPGSVEILTWLKNNNVDVAVATTKPTLLASEILSQIELRYFIDHVQGSEGLRPKPSSDVFIKLQNSLTYVPDIKFSIGDRVSDMKASLNAGYNSTLLNSMLNEVMDEGFSLKYSIQYNRVSTLNSYKEFLSHKLQELDLR